MNILFLILLAFRININNATLDEIKKLPVGYQDADSIYHEILKAHPDTTISLEDILKEKTVPEWKAKNIYEYIFYHGGISSYYELSEIRGVNAGDLARWKKYIYIEPRREGRNLIFDIQRVRSRTASEESPRESALDWWILKLVEPINVNKAEVDELYALDRVSLIDAAAVVRRARILPLRNRRDLRRVPHLSYYGYRNMVNFVTYRDRKPRMVDGWLNIYSSYYPDIYIGESLISDVISNLSDSLSREDYLRAGWTDEEIDSLASRLRKEREELSALSNYPYFRTKVVSNVRGKLRFGLLFEKSPTRVNELKKGFIGVEKVKLAKHFYLSKLYVGNIRVTLGQGLVLDNSDELRDRLISRARGIYGDVTSNTDFAFNGVAFEFKYLGFNPIFVYSKNSRNAILDRDGNPLFYFVGHPAPSVFKNKLTERVLATSLRFNLGGNTLPVGTQVALNLMKLTYSKPFSLVWEDVTKPFSKEEASGPAFEWHTGKENLFGSLELRTVLFPFSIELEAAKQKDAGSAYLLKARIQENPYYFNIIFRHYGVDYTNPYMRTFQEASRFQYTVLDRNYRLNDPLYSNLSNFPVPKPETGIYVESRYQVSSKLIFPRVYLDVWRDNTTMLDNYRFQGSVEYRLVNPLRLRFTEKIQNRHSARYLGITRSLTYETTLRLYYVFRGTYMGITLRHSRVLLTPREDYSNEINGGYLALDLQYPVARSLDFRLGTTVWRNNGMSQWGFEDTGIDFMYGNGSKVYFSIVERLTRNMGVKLKFRLKNTYYPHGGLLGQGIYNPITGNWLTGFSEERNAFSFNLSFDYRF